MKPGRLFRQILLYVHLVAGLSAGLVLLVIGLTGAALAFRDDYVHWTHPAFFAQKPSGAPMSQETIVAKIEAAYPGRVTLINSMSDGTEFLFMDNNKALIANPIDGRILDANMGKSFTSQIVIKAFDWHTKLARGKIGQAAVDIATYETLVLVPTGVFLWWKVKRFSIKRKPWRRFFWDLHNSAGIVVALPLLFLGFTGSLIALKMPASRFSHANPQLNLKRPTSPAPASGAERIHLDAALAAAEAALPNSPTIQIGIPRSRFDAFVIHKQAGGWLTGGQLSSVYIDQYSGAVLRVDDARKLTTPYLLYQFARKAHSADPFGTAVRAVYALASLTLAVSAVTGFVLGLLKLAAVAKRLQSKRLTDSQNQKAVN